MRTGAIVVSAALFTGCGLTQPEAPRRSEAMEISARMLRQLDKLEADLHENYAQNTLYSELVERHGHAQQIACNVTQEHVDEIHRLAMAQEQKLERKLGHKLAKRRAPTLPKKKAVAQLTPRRGRS